VNRPAPVHLFVGRNINRLRNAAKFTQEQLAEKADIDRRSLQRIEAGQWNMTVDYLDRIRRCLKRSWADIFQGIE
jgi:transcriptional regulator with XRE-family HTH domain